MKKVCVLGLGISGKAAAEQLLAEGVSVIAVDKKATLLRQDPVVVFLLQKGLELQTEEDPLSFSSLSWVLLSPGIPLTHPYVQRALLEGLEVISEIEFAMRRLSNPCIAVTGSNGKTTTTLLIEHVLKTNHIPARALGNVGFPLSSYVSELRKSSSESSDYFKSNQKKILVVELSSFQLEMLHSRCLRAAVILNIVPNHLDRYPSMKEYAAAKLRISSCLVEGGKLFVSDQAKQYVPWGLSFEEEVQGSQNEQAAYSLCKLFGVTPEQFFHALKTFRKPPHRIEWVAEKNGCVYYNDSKASNVDAVIYAVNSLSGPLILLVGGHDKGAPYTPWIDCFKGKVKMLVAFGAAASKMELELAAFLPFSRVATIDEAVKLASQLATPGTSILLSPGCSSYDQFCNFEERGEVFKHLVKGLI